MAINLSNINPEFITPFTKCRVVSSDYPNIEGEYGIASASYMLSSTDMKHFMGNTVVSLLKK